MHPFLWQNGVMTDLNTLVPPGSPWLLLEALGNNDRGEIVGYALQTATGEVHAYLLTPCDEQHPDIEGCDYDEVEATAEAPTRSATAATGTVKSSTTEIMKRSHFSMANRYRGFGALPLK